MIRAAAAERQCSSGDGSKSAQANSKCADTNHGAAITEVQYQVLANLLRTVHAGGGVEQLPGPNTLERDNCYAEKHLPMLLRLPSSEAALVVKPLCFSEPDLEGAYFGKADYAPLYGLAANIQYAFEPLEEAVAEARKAIKERIEKSVEAVIRELAWKTVNILI